MAGVRCNPDLSGLDVSNKPGRASTVIQVKMLFAAVELVKIGINPG